MDIEHLLDPKANIIACKDQFCWDFLASCALEGVKLKVIPYDENPRRTAARMWLLKIHMDKDKLVPSLRLKSPWISMDDWAVFKEEEPQTNSQTFLFRINRECMEALEKVDY